MCHPLRTRLTRLSDRIRYCGSGIRSWTVHAYRAVRSKVHDDTRWLVDDSADVLKMTDRVNVAQNDWRFQNHVSADWIGRNVPLTRREQPWVTSGNIAAYCGAPLTVNIGRNKITIGEDFNRSLQLSQSLMLFCSSTKALCVLPMISRDRISRTMSSLHWYEALVYESCRADHPLSIALLARSCCLYQRGT